MCRDIYVKRHLRPHYRLFSVHAKYWRRHTWRSLTVRVGFDMASCRVDQKRALTAHFKQRAVLKFCANNELIPPETWTFLENITVEKRALDRSFLTGTSDFGKV